MTGNNIHYTNPETLAEFSPDMLKQYGIAAPDQDSLSPASVANITGGFVSKLDGTRENSPELNQNLTLDIT